MVLIFAKLGAKVLGLCNCFRMRTARDLSVCRSYQMKNVFQQLNILYFTKVPNNKNGQIMACKIFITNNLNQLKCRAFSSVFWLEISGQLQKKGVNNFY